MAKLHYIPITADVQRSIEAYARYEDRRKK